jgi:hypothetical protein
MTSRKLSEVFDRVAEAVENVQTALRLEPVDVDDGVFSLRKLATRLEAFEKLRSESNADAKAYCDDLDKHGVDLWNASTRLHHAAPRRDSEPSTARLVAERRSLCPGCLIDTLIANGRELSTTRWRSYD